MSIIAQLERTRDTLFLSRRAWSAEDDAAHAIEPDKIPNEPFPQLVNESRGAAIDPLSVRPYVLDLADGDADISPRERMPGCPAHELRYDLLLSRKYNEFILIVVRSGHVPRKLGFHAGWQVSKRYDKFDVSLKATQLESCCKSSQVTLT